MKKILIIGCLLIATVPQVLLAQDEKLKELLKGKNRLDDIMQMVKKYYNDPGNIAVIGETEKNRQVKKWKRFEWYMSSRLGSNGEFVNINKKMLEATGLQQKNNVQNSTAGNWVIVGPTTTTSGIGRVDRLAFHPTDPDIVYAGSTAGGLWRTTNAGASWTNITPNIPCGGIGGIALDPTNTNRIFILTGDGDSDIGGLVDNYGYMRLSIGVLKSTNGGASWQKTGNFPGADYTTLVGYRLVMRPGTPDIMYACTSQGLWWTLNGGDTWGQLNPTGRFYNLVFHPANNTILYATGTNGSGRFIYWRGTASGLIMDTINAVNNLLNFPSKRTEIAVTPANPELVYLLAGGTNTNNPGTFRGLYRSINAGLNFALMSNSPNIVGRRSDGSDSAEQSNYDLALTVSNTSASTVVAGGIQVWRSLNSGSTWAYRGALHDDVHDLGFHPADNKLWAACDGGVYSSTDNGANWTDHFTNMNVSQFYRMDVNPDNYLNMVAGAQDNGMKRRTGNTSNFDDISGSDAFTVGYDAANSSIFYAILNTSVVRFTNDGNNNNNISPTNSNNPFSMGLAPSTSQANGLFIGSDSIWRTSNGGASWNVSPNINGGWFLRTCPSNGNRVYAAGGTSYSASTGILRRSDDAGVTWPAANILSNKPGFPGAYPKITSINVDPTNSLRVWITFGGFTDNVKVYYSADGGLNWVNRSGTLPNVPINCIAIDNSNNAYLGTDNGIYYRASSMSDWVPFYNNLPYVPVTDIIITEAENRVRAATFGRGIWSSDLYSSCSTNLTIGGTLEGQEFYTAASSITSDASLQTSIGTSVQMRGGFEIHLQPGFTARESTRYRALIGPCTGGGVAGFILYDVNENTVIPVRQYLAPKGPKNVLLHVNADNNHDKKRIILDAKKSGTVKLVITTEDGVVKQIEDNISVATGRNEWILGTSKLPSGQYYIQALFDGRLEHVQELIL